MSIIEIADRSRAEILDDRGIAALAERCGTPLYIYDLTRLRQRIADLRAALKPANAALFFATMANDRTPVLQLMAKLGLGACVNSIPHLALASQCGFDNENVQFTSTGMTPVDMGALQRRRIRCNLDSLSQLDLWFELGGAEAGIRVNASSLGCGLPMDRIGIDARQVGEAEAIARSHGRTLNGLHIYVGTNFQQPDAMLPTMKAFFERASAVNGLRYVNIGGGIGVNYRHDGPAFDIAAFGVGLAAYASRLRDRLGHDVEVIVEPGRGLTAECARFIVAVTDVKELGGRPFATVDASVAIFPRPFHHPDSPHRVRRVGEGDGYNDAAAPETLIVGRTTFSRDILGSMRTLHPLRRGDLLELADAGAYSQSMRSCFLGQPDPEEVFIGD